MRFLKHCIVDTSLVVIMMMAIILCCSTQVQAEMSGDYTYTITDGKAQITKYSGSGEVVTIPNTIGGATVTSIGEAVLPIYTGITTINIPQGVTSIDTWAFTECTRLTSINVAIDNLNFTSIDGVLFNKAGTIIITCPSGLSAINIPQGVTSIGKAAFYSCTGLTSISIPQGVTSIGGVAFSHCSGLTSISIPQGVTSIGGGAFSHCTGLTSINIPQGVTSIGDYAFYICTGLTSISIPQRVTSIGNYAFYYCTGLTSISIPQGVVSIGKAAFRNCTGLTSISIPPGVTSIGDYAFHYCTGLTNISIPPGVTRIGDYTFYNCTGLTSISIPQGVESIGDHAFSYCTGLSSISIPQGVTSIGNSAFFGCKVLTSIRFNSATTIIYDSKDTIPPVTRILGYDPSTVKEFATKYDRRFGITECSATPLVEIGINPNDRGRAGIFVGLMDIVDNQGNVVTDAKLIEYQIDVDYDAAKVIIPYIVDETNSDQTFKTDDSGNVTIIYNSATGITDINKLFFIPITLTGSALDEISLQVKYLSVSDVSDNQIYVENPTALVLQRGKILNDEPDKAPDTNDAVVGLQYLSGLINAGADSDRVNVINMASIVGPDNGSAIVKSNVKDIIALMQYLVGLRDPHFNVIDGGDSTSTLAARAGFHLTENVVYYNSAVTGRGTLEIEGVNGKGEQKVYTFCVDSLEVVSGSNGVKYEVSENYSTTFPTKIDKFALSAVTPGNVKIVALDESGVQIGAAIADVETEAQDNDLIELNINDEGVITGLSFLAELIFSSSQTTNILLLEDKFINGYMLKANTLVFKDHSYWHDPDPEDIVVTTWGALADKGFIVAEASYYVNSNNEVDYLVIKRSYAAATTDYNAAVTDVRLNSDGLTVRISVLLDGVQKIYGLDELYTFAVFRGSVVTLSVIDDGGGVVRAVATGKQGLVTDVNLAYRTITIDSDINANDGTYRLVTDASVINSKNLTDIIVTSLRDVQVGDTVTLSLDEKVPATSYFVDVVNIQRSTAATQ